jgi:circadian clock protein KaiC
LDDITGGGLPIGRPTLVCGAAGAGKTLFAITFLVNGATQHNEPGVIISFEERAEDLEANFASLGYDLHGLAAEGKLLIDHVRIERNEIEEAGEYDLEGLFVRLNYAVDSIGAKRVVLDTIESLFSGFTNQGILRAELRRLFGWIKDRGLTTIVTGESNNNQLTSHGLEEYVSDCVILLDNRVQDQLATRRLRVVKYRGSTHAIDEFPFLIDADGISVLPITTFERHRALSAEIISSGITDLDAMIRNGGFYRGSSILVSGVAGTGKTTIASQFIDAACRRGERCIFFAYEEGADEITRNALSFGIDLAQHITADRLRFVSTRPTLFGLETHLARMHRDIDAFKPAIVVVDPISAFRGPDNEVYATLLRMVDLLKCRGVTAMFTSLRNGASLLEGTDQGLSSLMDSWIKLSDTQVNGERNRILYLIKSRGTSHSNQLREFRITDDGIKLVEAYFGPEGVLTGTARLTQEAREQAEAKRRAQETERRRRHLARRREALQRQIANLQAVIEADEEEEQTLIFQEEARVATLARDRDHVFAHWVGLESTTAA